LYEHDAEAAVTQDERHRDDGLQLRGQTSRTRRELRVPVDVVDDDDVAALGRGAHLGVAIEVDGQVAHRGRCSASDDRGWPSSRMHDPRSLQQDR